MILLVNDRENQFMRLLLTVQCLAVAMKDLTKDLEYSKEIEEVCNRIQAIKEDIENE